jgi:hypothetical protein
VSRRSNRAAPILRPWPDRERSWIKRGHVWRDPVFGYGASLNQRAKDEMQNWASTLDRCARQSLWKR